MMKSRKCFLQMCKKYRLTSLHCAVEEKDYKIVKNTMYTSHLIFIASFWCIIRFSSAFPTKISSYTTKTVEECLILPIDNITEEVQVLIRDKVNPTLNAFGRPCNCGGLEWTRVADLNMAEALDNYLQLDYSIELGYIDGISLTHGSPGSRMHIWSFLEALSVRPTIARVICPCTNVNESWPYSFPHSLETTTSVMLAIRDRMKRYISLMTHSGMDKDVVLLVPAAKKTAHRGSVQNYQVLQVTTWKQGFAQMQRQQMKMY